MPTILKHLKCLFKGHEWHPLEMLDYVENRGTVVVELECSCCEQRLVHEFEGKEFTDPVPEGPWTTELCILCDKRLLRSQTAYAELWPMVAMCGTCAERWERVR